MKFAEWQAGISNEIKGDPLWGLEVYRLALFVGDIAWQDAQALNKNNLTRDLADQLYRAVCSISANIAEGYSRSTGKDRARFFEYALGSARG
jgi:four helix bundle protein